MGSWNCLYDESLKQCPDQGYYGLGRKLILASDSLRKKVSGASKQSIEDQAVMTLYNYIKPTVAE